MIRSTLVVTKQTPFARNGMVAAEHWRGAEVGAGILARGGNAVDAAVATAFAMTVIEPFMSTIAGSGTMLVHLARKGETLALNFNGLAPLAGHETLYKVVGGVSDGLFSWPRTENSANEYGHRSVAVPGSLAGLRLALERYGTMELRDVLAPAIALARDGFEADWYLAQNHAKFERGAGGVSRDARATICATAAIATGRRDAAGRSLDVSGPGAQPGADRQGRAGRVLSRRHRARRSPTT
jgi:gamma-glutamyltranspeptidase/glutathione hydrolase